MSGERTMGRMMPEDMGWRMWAGMIACVGAVIAVIVWLFFYAGGFNIYQNVAVIGVIFLACFAVMGAIMAPWFMKQRASWSRRESS